MKSIYITRNVLVPAVLLALSVLSAPVQQTDSAEKQDFLITENDDNSAKELEQLSETGDVVIPAAPVVAEFVENDTPKVESILNTDESEEADSNADVSKEVPVSTNSFPLKRQFPIPSLSNDNGAFPGDGRRFPTFSAEEEDISLYPRQPAVDLSPRAVAEYLLVTTDFDGFEQAMGDLMNIGVLSPSEVLQYKDSVSWEYESLLRQMAQAESQYLQELSRVSPMDYFNTIQQPVRSYPEYPFNQNSLEYPDTDVPSYRDQISSLLDSQGYPRQISDVSGYREQQPNIQEMLKDKQRTLDDVLNLVLNEYYGKEEQQQREEQPQQQDSVIEYDERPEYEQIAPAEPASYETSDDSNDMTQFMAYLQRTLTSEEAAAGIIEIPDKSDEEKDDHTDKTEHSDGDVAKELNELSAGENDESSETEEQSGEIDSDMKPEIESASS